MTSSIQLITIPTIEDTRGNIAVVEKNTLPFTVKRVYYLYDVPAGAYRGGHSHKEQWEVLIAVSGSFNVLLNDGKITTITLSRPNEGLVIPNGIWRELTHFSAGAVCLVLASGEFAEDDYIRDFEEFVLTIRR